MRAAPELALRRGIPADAESMASIHAACFVRGWDAAAMAQFVTAPGCLCLLAAPEQDAAPQSLLIARLAADEAELLTLAVHPDYRREGFARHLLAAAISALRAAGAKHLFLEVDSGNHAARSLYVGFGAAQIGSRTRYYEHGADAAIFSLALSDPAADDAIRRELTNRNRDEQDSHTGKPA